MNVLEESNAVATMPTSDDVFFSDFSEMMNERCDSRLDYSDLHCDLSERFAPNHSPGFHAIKLPEMTYWPGCFGLVRGMRSRDGRLEALGKYLHEGYPLRAAAIFSQSCFGTAKRLFDIFTASGKVIYCGCGKPSGKTHTGHCWFIDELRPRIEMEENEKALSRQRIMALELPPINIDKARRHFEEIRWGQDNIIGCVHCRTYQPDAVMRLHGGRSGLLMCRRCRKQFTVTVKTRIEGARFGLDRFLKAFYYLKHDNSWGRISKLNAKLGHTSWKTTYANAKLIDSVDTLSELIQLA